MDFKGGSQSVRGACGPLIKKALSNLIVTKNSYKPQFLRVESIYQFGFDIPNFKLIGIFV
jgi:hypothetical protein